MKAKYHRCTEGRSGGKGALVFHTYVGYIDMQSNFVQQTLNVRIRLQERVHLWQ